jgi:type I restriction enzyme R subunit
VDDYPVLDDDVERFATVWFDASFDPSATSRDQKQPGRRHQQLTDALAPAEQRFAALAEEQQDEFRSVLNQFVGMYSFLAKVLPWSDPDLEKRHAHAQLLSRRLADERGKALDLSDELEMTHYHLQQSFHGKVEPGDTEVMAPTFSGGHGALTKEEQAAFAEIIASINDQFGAGLDEQHRVIAEGMALHALADQDAQSKLAANPQDKAWIAFEQMWSEARYAYLDEHTEFIKTLFDQPEIEKRLGKAVFDYVYREARRRQS